MEQPGQVGMCLHVPQNPEGSNLNGDSWCLIPPTELTKGQACATLTPFGYDKAQYRPIDKGDIPRAGTASLLIYFGPEIPPATGLQTINWLAQSKVKDRHSKGNPSDVIVEPHSLTVTDLDHLSIPDYLLIEPNQAKPSPLRFVAVVNSLLLFSFLFFDFLFLILPYIYIILVQK